jgi:glycine hydroxymethyltransferase
MASPVDQLEVHDPASLSVARALLDSCDSPRQMALEVIEAVKRNEEWRGRQCINLLAPEAPTTPMVRALLSSEIGTRAAEGSIGAMNRWFAGTKHIDEVESLCVELLKKAFRCNYADHRLMGSMLGNMAVYYALTEPGDTIMSVAQPLGGHSSNRPDGPAGMRGLKIVDIPFDARELTVDVEAFRQVAEAVQPKLVTIGMSMTLFPYPVAELAEIAAGWGGRIFFDGAHQAGLIAGGQYQDPLAERAAVLTGSAGKTFAGPQSGMMMWNDPALTKPLTTAVFPVLAATHQVNRVAALAVAAAEMLAFGQQFMAQIVKNAQALAASLDRRGVPMLGGRKGYTRTHQAIANVKQFGGGLEVAHRLARANLITNKNLLPDDQPQDWDRPSGLRMGTIEVTRLGMVEKDMDTVAGFIARILVDGIAPEKVAPDVLDFRAPFQTLYYSFEEGYPPALRMQ